MFWLIVLIVFLFVSWFVAQKYLAPPNLSHFDTPVGERFASHDDDAEHTANLVQTLRDLRVKAKASKSIKQSFAIAREFADNMSSDLESDCEFTQVVANGVPCEWAVAPNSDPERRVLLLHGGAFALGSPKGHRHYSHRLAHIAKAVVLSVDYRMLPEHKRMAATLDAQNAYHWILTQGPEGETPLSKLMVVGDSAGGNLTLMLGNWSKKFAARKPDAVIAVAPSTDSTLASPTVKANLATDIVLGQMMGLLSKLPRTLSLWVGLALMRTPPNNPLISPLFDDLDNLAPTLIHASSNECLLGDSIRFTNKAIAAGSDVSLQIWENQLHDWHIFTPESGSGREAWGEIAKFVEATL